MKIGEGEAAMQILMPPSKPGDLPEDRPAYFLRRTERMRNILTTTRTSGLKQMPFPTKSVAATIHQGDFQ